ncbi:GGDEF domain-containing protein [Desertibaculum subflavum]|uniref:GGDEF domain-containing protein n=1 Tax=Desertibaculum subflavum TaxID=2268458 RepID=UPI000E674236
MTPPSPQWNELLERLGVRSSTFDKGQDAAAMAAMFRRAAWNRARLPLRIVMIAAAAMFVLFWYWDRKLDPVGAETTLPIRLAAGAAFAALAVLPSLIRLAWQCIACLYAAGTLLAAALLVAIALLLQDGYPMLNGSIVLVVMSVAIIGPYDRFAAPLTLAVAAIPNLTVLALHLAAIPAPGLPAPDRAISIAMLHGAAALLALLLMRLHSVDRENLFAAQQELHRLATTDPLTGAKNRRVLQERFALEVARQSRLRGSTALLMLDIDHFKQVNDTYGHSIGDEVLRDLVQRWTMMLRDIDLLCRIGGEEFVALLPDTLGLDALVIAERLRHETAELPVATSAGPIKVTISLGVTVVGPGIDDLDLVLERADAALFEAKAAGRDRVMVSTPLALAA